MLYDVIEDGMDETLCPVDYAKAGVIVDDDVHDVLVRGLPKVSPPFCLDVFSKGCDFFSTALKTSGSIHCPSP